MVTDEREDEREETIEAEWTIPSVALAPRPENDPVVKGFREQVERLLEYAKKAVVTDLRSAQDAANDAVMANTLWKALEQKRKEYKAPCLEAGEGVDKFFAKLKNPAKEADDILSGKVIAWKKEEDRKRADIERLNRLAEEKAKLEREMAESKAREERERQEREQREAEELAARLHAPPPPPLPPPAPLPVAEAPRPLEVPDEQKRVRAEAGVLTPTRIPDRDKIQAAIDNGVREIKGVYIYPVWTFKVLEAKDVPDEYKRDGKRTTR